MVVNMTTAVSLFAGVGGFDLALERAGVKVVATVEWDKHAQKVLQRRLASVGFEEYGLDK
jgi:DNA (cytosine-5)-methyltransferase 1